MTGPAVQRPYRIAVLNTHPIQYFAPLYAYINRHTDIEITALYLSDHGVQPTRDADFGEEFSWDIDLLAGYPYQFVGKVAGRRVVNPGYWEMTDTAIWGAVRNGGFDALWTHGHAYGSNIIAMLAARSKNMPVFLRGETSEILRRRGVRGFVRSAYHRFALSLCDQFLAIGEANRQYYLDHGMSPDRIHTVPYVVDNERFVAQSRLTPAERAALRQELGLSGDAPVVLYLSKLQRRKHPEYVVEAAARLREKGLDLQVLFVGSGEMEEELRQLVAARDLGNVHFAGFRNQSELPRLYAAADIFVLPAEQEPFGLVINEALCAGLPVVTTDEVGSAYDLVRPGTNGAVVPAGDLNLFIDALEPLVASADLRAAYGEAGRAIIAGHGFAQCLDGLRSAVQASRAALR